MKRIKTSIAQICAIFLTHIKPYEVVNIEQMHYDRQLVEVSLFCIKCIKSCNSLDQLRTCSAIMHTHLTCRYIAHPLYIKYWDKVVRHYHFRLKLLNLIHGVK